MEGSGFKEISKQIYADNGVKHVIAGKFIAIKSY